jgi:hypothetical protein
MSISSAVRLLARPLLPILQRSQRKLYESGISIASDRQALVEQVADGEYEMVLIYDAAGDVAREIAERRGLGVAEVTPETWRAAGINTWDLMANTRAVDGDRRPVNEEYASVARYFVRTSDFAPAEKTPAATKQAQASYDAVVTVIQRLYEYFCMQSRLYRRCPGAAPEHLWRKAIRDETLQPAVRLKLTDLFHRPDIQQTALEIMRRRSFQQFLEFLGSSTKAENGYQKLLADHWIEKKVTCFMGGSDITKILFASILEHEPWKADLTGDLPFLERKVAVVIVGLESIEEMMLPGFLGSRLGQYGNVEVFGLRVPR